MLALLLIARYRRQQAMEAGQVIKRNGRVQVVVQVVADIMRRKQKPLGKAVSVLRDMSNWVWLGTPKCSAMMRRRRIIAMSVSAGTNHNKRTGNHSPLYTIAARHSA